MRINKGKPQNFFLLAGIFFMVFFAIEAKSIGSNESIVFNVDSNFDASARSQIQAVLIKTEPNLYFYAEKNWWDLQIADKKTEVLNNLGSLSSEFSNRIYPTLTSVFGSEWKSGVDGDNKITIFFHSMKEGAEGYFRSADEYIKLQVPDSNEREMLYINLSRIDDPKIKIFVSHEFVHLITFNQKDRINGVHEEIWLNEARADFAPVILGYDNPYEGSNLQARVKDFLQNPTDSLAEWQGNKYDYSVAGLFMYYLVDHYGVDILSSSLKSKLSGIDSINEALLKQGANENFGQIFANWQIATVLNDCSLNLKYCYLNQNLKKIKINPVLNFLPLSGNSSLSVSNVTKNWSGNWQKIIGGNGGNLNLEFESLKSLNFVVPYIVFDRDNFYSIKFIQLDVNERGRIEIDNFGTQYTSLIIMPSLQTKVSGFDGAELTYPYTFTVSTLAPESKEDKSIIQKLLDQIDYLKKQIAALQNKAGQKNLCYALNSNLRLGTRSNDVKCLQQFLADQSNNIYPEKLVTGYFGSLTKIAVTRFQEKNGIPSTGFVGVLTRAKINQLLSS